MDIVARSDDERSPIIIEDDALRGGFTQVPNSILRHPTISPGAKLAYATLLMYAWRTDRCFPGQETMAADIGVTDRSVRTYLGQLERAALISVTQRGLGRTNLYIIHRLRPEDIADQGPQPEDIAAQERNVASGQERQPFPTKKIQVEEETINEKDTPLDLAERMEIRFQDQIDALEDWQVAWLARHGIVDGISWRARLGLPLGESPERTWRRASRALKGHVG